MERFGFDPTRARAADTLGAVYHMLCEEVSSEYGLLLEPAPPRPRVCDFAGSGDPAAVKDAYREALGAWELELCGLTRWTSRDELDANLPGRRAVHAVE